MPNLNNAVIKHTVALILRGQDHRESLGDLINREFLLESIDFFKQIVNAKLNNQSISLDWYKETFLDRNLNKQNIAANAGLSIKTINNKRKSSRLEIVLEESNAHIDYLISLIDELCDTDTDIEIDLSITYRNVTVHLNLNESLVVVNTLAIRRLQIRGGLWSKLGKNVEEPLLRTMCTIYRVPEENYATNSRKEVREVDFSLISRELRKIRCEVKLMGKGNPEGADSTFARNSDVFVGSTLSATNKIQLETEGVQWVELRQPYGFLKFGDVLEHFDVPHTPIPHRQRRTLDLMIDHAAATVMNC